MKTRGQEDLEGGGSALQVVGSRKRERNRELGVRTRADSKRVELCLLAICMRT